jgi:hypothetical protein
VNSLGFCGPSPPAERLVGVQHEYIAEIRHSCYGFLHNVIKNLKIKQLFCYCHDDR